MTNTFDTLRKSLQRVMSEVKFDVGRVTSEDPGGTTRSYNRRQGEVIGPECLRQMYAEARQGNQEALRARSAHVFVPGELGSHLADCIRCTLSRYHDPKSDCVGHAFPMSGAGNCSATLWPSGIHTQSYFSSIDQFRGTIIKWAAMLGINSVIDLLAEWTREESLAYRTNAVVGLTLNQSIQPTNGIRITPLPLSTAELPSWLPKRNNIHPSAYLGHAILSVDTLATPVLFRPVSRYNLDIVKGKLHQDFDFNLISEALSLECNMCIDTGIRWNDYGDLDMLADDRTTWGGLQSLGQPIGFQSKTGSLRGPTTIQIREDAIQSPSEDAINNHLIALKKADTRTRRAVARWKKSMMKNASVTDGFIDLRIALESLFLPQDYDQQLKFRLATNGAWLVGDDGVDRKQAWDTLRRAYDKASKAVHRGELSQKDEKVKKNKSLLAEAQSVCREGIFRVLRNGRINNWNDLILDVPTQS